MSEEIERTEELLEPVKNHGRKKKMVVISIAIILIIISGIGIFLISSNIKDSNYKKQLYLGNKYLEEGIYSEAILAFDKAIEIEGKLPEAYEMKAKACTASGDYETAKEIYFKLYDDSGDARFKELEDNVGMGNTSGNLANGGIATKSEDAIYIGNKPKAGSITMTKNGEENIIYEIKNDIKYICDLNISGEWLYFTIRNMGGLGLAEEKPQNGIYKIKIDGSGFTALKLSGVSESYYDLSLQGSKLYALNSNKSGRSLYQMDLNGNNPIKVVNEQEGLTCYTIDSENLYYSSLEGIICIEKSGNRKNIMKNIPNSVGVSQQIFVNAGKLYYTANGLNGERTLYSINMDGSDNKVIVDSVTSDVSSMGVFNILNNKLYYTKTAKSDGSSSTEYSHVLEIHVKDLNNDTDQILIQENAKASDLGYSSMDRIYADINNITLVDDKIYYEVRASSGVGGSYLTFFRMNQDGTENEVISRK